MDSFSINGGNVDVTKIMEKIQRRIKKKQERGIYTDEELIEVSRLRLETLADEVDIDSNLIEHLRNSSGLWNISPDYPIKSHRVGLSYFIVLIKRLVQPVTRLYTDHIVKRQAQLNLYTIHILHNLVEEITKLQIENRKLKSRIENLEKSHKFSNKRFKTANKSSSSTRQSGRRKSFANKKN